MCIIPRVLHLLALDLAAALVSADEVVYEVLKGGHSRVESVDQPVNLACVIAEVNLLHLPFKGPIERIRHKLHRAQIFA